MSNGPFGAGTTGKVRSQLTEDDMFSKSHVDQILLLLYMSASSISDHCEKSLIEVHSVVWNGPKISTAKEALTPVSYPSIVKLLFPAATSIGITCQ